MSKPTIYKKTNRTTGRTTHALSSDEQTQVTNLISTFITYFKAKHL